MAAFGFEYDVMTDERILPLMSSAAFKVALEEEKRLCWNWVVTNHVPSKLFFKVTYEVTLKFYFGFGDERDPMKHFTFSVLVPVPAPIVYTEHRETKTATLFHEMELLIGGTVKGERMDAFLLLPTTDTLPPSILRMARAYGRGYADFVIDTSNVVNVIVVSK